MVRKRLSQPGELLSPEQPSLGETTYRARLTCRLIVLGCLATVGEPQPELQACRSVQLMRLSNRPDSGRRLCVRLDFYLETSRESQNLAGGDDDAVRPTDQHRASDISADHLRGHAPLWPVGALSSPEDPATFGAYIWSAVWELSQDQRSTAQAAPRRESIALRH
jgi:hypothetical protein